MCGVYFAFGVMISAIPPMVTEVRGDLGISRGQLGVALAAWPLLYIVMSPMCGSAVDRFGTRLCITIGSATVAVAGLVQALSGGLVTLSIGVALIGVGGPLISVSAPAHVGRWFTVESERNLALGLYTAAPALGTIATLLWTHALLLPILGGWRAVILAETVLCVVVTLIWVQVSSRVGAEIYTATRGVTRARGVTKKLLRIRGVWFAIVLGMGAFFVNQALASWLPNILEEDGGLTPRAASNLVAVSAVVGIGARIALPGSVPTARVRGLVAAVMLSMAISMLAIAYGPPPVDVAATIALGLRSALSPLIILILMASDGVTTANLGAAYGIWFSLVEIGGSAGPIFVGVVGDSVLGFDVALAALSVVMLAMVGVALTLSSPRRPGRRRRAPAPQVRPPLPG
jgi:CP family cyanate transporter-like MFS transporter